MISHGTRNLLVERLRRMFGAPPSRVQVAALPWRPSSRGIEIMLVTSRGTGRWVLPKGWPEKAETLSQAAEREAGEEAGITGGIARQPIGSSNTMSRRKRSGSICITASKSFTCTFHRSVSGQTTSSRCSRASGTDPKISALACPLANNGSSLALNLQHSSGARSLMALATRAMSAGPCMAPAMAGLR